MDTALDPRISFLLPGVGSCARKILQQITPDDVVALAQLNRALVGDEAFGVSTTLYCLRDHSPTWIDAARHSWSEQGGREEIACGGRTAIIYRRFHSAYAPAPRSLAALPLGANLIVLEAVERLSEGKNTMEHPHPVNLLTPEQSRAGGWQAEARDGDGHLRSQHAPFENDGEIAEYVKAEMDRGCTVTIWPVDPARRWGRADV